MSQEKQIEFDQLVAKIVSDASIFTIQSKFMEAGDVPFPDRTTEGLDLPAKLIREEYLEWEQEITVFDGSLKECIDLIYVCCQYMNTAVGPIKAQLLFNAVHKNNMSKCIDGKLVKREDGKVLKPEGFDKEGWRSDFDKILEGNV